MARAVISDPKRRAALEPMITTYALASPWKCSSPTTGGRPSALVQGGFGGTANPAVCQTCRRLAHSGLATPPIETRRMVENDCL